MLKDTPFADLTVERICQETGIARSTFYNHFPDQATLLIELAEDVFAASHDVVSPWWDADHQLTRDELAAVLTAVAALYERHRPLLVALSDAGGVEPTVRAGFARMFDVHIMRFADYLRRGQEHGFVASRIHPEQTAGWIIWMIERGLYQLFGDEKSGERERLSEALTDVVWGTLHSGTRADLPPDSR
ncbi:TetR/AcrR family transcriptional regulator [Paraconexibacter sp. AEG42_29]|uniref:TetR/AcrR family transcriptional regulator n=1 Tax=Paraconexibacter sp. AEG42_29 TaxID=2997339 RepID=UPI00339D95BC